MPKHVLFVCYANKFRSVVAEYLLRKMFRERDEELAQEIEVSSAGLGLINKKSLELAKGKPLSFLKSTFRRSPDEYVIAAMLRKGIDISNHRLRRVNRGMVEKSNLIIAMEGNQKERILSIYPSAKGKVFTLKEFVGNTQSLDIGDPIGSCYPEHFDACISEIEECLKEGWEEMLSLLLAF